MGEGFEWAAGSYGQVGAAEEGQLDPTVDDQRERNGVLLLPQEAFRAVDRVKRPESRGVFLFAAAIDPVAGLLARRFDADRPQLFEHAFEERTVLLAAEGARFFLADDRVAREGGTNQATDGRLTGEVGDGDGAAIFLFKNVGRNFGLHVAADPRRGPHRVERDGQLGFPPFG